MKSLFYRSLLVATCLAVSTPALATPVVDGFLGVNEYSNSFIAGWYNGHNQTGSQFKKAGNHTTTVYWEKTVDNFYLYLEVPAKNMTWGTDFTENEIYYQHWCSPPDGEPAAHDGSNCGHHKDGFAKFVSDKVDFGTMTGSEKVIFPWLDPKFEANLNGDTKNQLYGKDLLDYKDSVDYVFASLSCDTTTCGAGDIPMAFEFMFADPDQNMIDMLKADLEISDTQTNELEFHLSPEGVRGVSPIPEPSAAVLFCVGALIVGNSVRRQPRAR